MRRAGLLLLALWLAAGSATGPASRAPAGSKRPPGSSPGTGTSTVPGGGAAEPLRVRDLLQVRFVEPLRGWAVAGSMILRIADGGASWWDVTPAGAGVGVTGWGGAFLDASHAWVVSQPRAPGRPTILYRTGDGGRSWTASPLDGTGFAQVRFVDRRMGWILLHQGAGAGNEAVTLLLTGDGGASWQEVVGIHRGAGASFPASVRLAASAEGPPQFDLVDVRDAVVTDGTTLYRTDDGGRTRSAGHLERSLAGVVQLDFVDPSTRWAPASTRARAT